MRGDRWMAAGAGCAGSVLIAVGGLRPGLGLVCVYAGVALLVLGWWWYRRAPHPRPWVTLGLWAAPLLAAPPMFSRDVYSYLAQGLMLQDGLDVYRTGPAALGGPVAAQVPVIWQYTPSPYGPVSLLASRAVTTVTGSDLAAGIVGMRLVAVGGLLLLAAAVPVLARGRGFDAFWLVVLNPLVLIHLVGGAHNDALMVGLLAAGLAVTVRQRPALGAAMIAAAALVKAPAALGLAAVAAIWAAQLGGRLPGLRATLATGAVAAAATVAITAITGTGYGWIGALSTPISSGNWSPTRLLGEWTAGSFGASLSMDLWRWAGMLATLVVAGLVWAYRHRLGPLAGLGIVLIALVAFGPAVRPWYAIWGLVPLGAALPAARRWLAVPCAALTLVVLPDGFAASLPEVVLAVMGVLLGVSLFTLAATPMTLRRVYR